MTKSLRHKSSLIAMASRQDELKAREKERVKAGKLDQIERLIIFTPLVSKREKEHWSVLDVAQLKELPPGIKAHKKMTKEERVQTYTMQPKGSRDVSWQSSVFARVEKGREDTNSSRKVIV